MKTYQVIKPVFYCFFLALCVFSLNAQQNLVPNGSFEEYDTCPVSNNLNDGQFERCKGWWSPTLGTPDYFNQCNNNINGVVGVPNNFWGYQEPFEGNGYVGFGAISWTKDSIKVTGLEYIQTKLNQSLAPCKNYYFRMYISCANGSPYGVGRVGAYVSKLSLHNVNLNVLEAIPQIIHQGPPLIDTLFWSKIEGTFTAEGGEKFLTIGYFFNILTNDTAFIQQYSNINEVGAYYYVDNVSLYEVNDNSQQPCSFHLEIPNVFTPNNDGVNDVLDLSEYVDFIENIRIINRWGNTVKVFTKNDPIWDGGNCVDGIYYYLIEDEKFKTKQTGFIHLIR